MARYVDIHLDRPRRIRYTINGIRELERFFGASFGAILAPENLGFEQIVQMLTVGLKHGDDGSSKRALTAEQVGELLQKKWLDNDKDLSDVVTLMMEALQAAGIIAKKEELDDEDEEGAAPASSDSGGGRPQGMKKAVVPNV